MNDTVSIRDESGAIAAPRGCAAETCGCKAGGETVGEIRAAAARRKIIFVNRFFSPDHSATSQLLSDLAFYLVEQADEVVVITSRLSYDNLAVRFAPREVVRGVDVRRVATTGFGRAGLLGRAVDLLSFYLSAGLALLVACRRGDVVVAKTDPPLLSVMAAAIVRLRGGRLVNWLQDIYPELAMAVGVPGMAGPFGRVLQRMRDASLRVACRNVVLGERMAERVAARGVSLDKIRIIANWADEEAIRPVPPAENPLRKTWGLEGKFVVGYSGNLGRAHDWKTMFEAAKQLNSTPEVQFLMIGGGHGMAQLRAAAAEAGLTNIAFKSYQDRGQLAFSLTLPDVHWISLEPAFEGLIVPSKIYGVLAAGRPVIAVDRRGKGTPVAG